MYSEMFEVDPRRNLSRIDIDNVGIELQKLSHYASQLPDKKTQANRAPLARVSVSIPSMRGYSESYVLVPCESYEYIVARPCLLVLSLLYIRAHYWGCNEHVHTVLRM